MRFLVTFLSIALLIAGNVAHSFALDMVIAYEDKEQPPFYMGEKVVLSEMPGVSVEMVLFIQAKIPDLHIMLVRYPWKRCLSALRSGEVSAIFNASFTKERQQYGFYPMKDGQLTPSRRMATISYSLYKKASSPVSWDCNKIDHLDGPIGAPSGYSIVSDLQKMGVKVEEAYSSISNLKKLQENRISACALQSITADSLLKKDTALKDIVKITPPLNVKDYYLILSHQFVDKQPDMAQKIWDAIGDIRESQFDSLMAKYAN